MLVCSVSTLIFNANPLLRYDGYYVLADLCDVPNLAERSRKLLAGYSNRLLFGLDELPRDTASNTGRLWMVIYAMVAMVYRWVLMLLILWIVALMLRPYGLESISRLLCLAAFAGITFNLLRPVARFAGNPARRRGMRRPRTVASILALSALSALACYPLPSGVSAPAKLLARKETPIYVSTPGLLRSVDRRPGQTVSEGDALATLINREVELRYVTAKGRYETQKLLVDSLRRMAIDTPEVSTELPAQEALLDDLQTQLQTRQSRWEGLTIRAPTSGRLIAAPRRPEATEMRHRLVNWSGYPTDSRNRDCLMESGQELMSVVADERWDAELVLDQSDVQRIKVGAGREAGARRCTCHEDQRKGHRCIARRVDSRAESGAKGRRRRRRYRPSTIDVLRGSRPVGFRRPGVCDRCSRQGPHRGSRDLDRGPSLATRQQPVSLSMIPLPAQVQARVSA